MSERVQKRPAGRRPMSSKAERRLARAAAAKAAAAKRRRQQRLLVALAAVVVVAVIVGAFALFGGGSDETPKQTAATPSADAATPSADAPAATSAEFPPLPAGADPALKTKPAVTKGSGTLTKLTVAPLIKGTGPAARAGQQITVNYVGVSYATGQEFDASWNRSQPFTFELGAGNVIPGWDQGLVGVTVGSRVQLDIPSKLAYGDNPGGGRPAGPLRFVVDVLGVQ